MSLKILLEMSVETEELTLHNDPLTYDSIKSAICNRLMLLYKMYIYIYIYIYIQDYGRLI